MNRLIRISALGGSISVIFPLVADKLMDTIVAVLTGGELNPTKFLILSGLLTSVALMVWVVQIGIVKIFSDLMRKFRRTDELHEAKGKLKTARKTIRNGLDYLKSQQAKFDKNVLLASQKVVALSAKDSRFSHSKQQASKSVISLKRDYHDNIRALEEVVENLYRRISEAERIFEGLDEWSQEAGKRYYKGPK